MSSGVQRAQGYRTDSRPLVERKVSVTMRIRELRDSLRAAELAEAEIDAAIEQESRLREVRRAALE